MAIKQEKAPKVERTPEELASFELLANTETEVKKRQPKQEKETKTNEQAIEKMRERLNVKQDESDPVLLRKSKK